jgi:tripartite motif-containing protein 2/3/tripartite motif-containing protein 71
VGSPFPVFVSIHPTLLGQPVRVITGLIRPRDIAITIDGSVAVTAPRDLTLFDRSGKKLRNVLALKFDIDDLLGVAADSTDGYIYICSFDNQIVKLNRNLELVGKFTGHELSSYKYLTVVGDDVMVSENFKCVVMVHSKDLKYLREFGSRGDNVEQFENIQCVTSAENRNIYVSDFNRGCVNVYSSSGEFLYSFGQGADCARKLCGPAGVCIAGRYVYVSDWYGHCVFVFTTEGEYVTSFGQYGNTEGSFVRPRGVCVDRDGFLYVCENKTDGRVQVF